MTQENTTLLLGLTDKERATLYAFEKGNMQLTAAARLMKVDRRTVLRRLQKIEERTGINPLQYRGLARLLVALSASRPTHKKERKPDTRTDEFRNEDFGKEEG